MHALSLIRNGICTLCWVVSMRVGCCSQKHLACFGNFGASAPAMVQPSPAWPIGVGCMIPEWMPGRVELAAGRQEKSSSTGSAALHADSKLSREKSLCYLTSTAIGLADPQLWEELPLKSMQGESLRKIRSQITTSHHHHDIAFSANLQMEAERLCCIAALSYGPAQSRFSFMMHR